MKIPVPVNDHWADLNTAQHDWPPLTLQNPEGSPLLAAAGCLRGFVDYVIYLIERGVNWVIDMLEQLDEFLVKALGAKWWIGTSFEQFARKPKGA